MGGDRRQGATRAGNKKRGKRREERGREEGRRDERKTMEGKGTDGRTEEGWKGESARRNLLCSDAISAGSLYTIVSELPLLGKVSHAWSAKTWSVATDVAWFVCMSVGHDREPYKMAELIDAVCVVDFMWAKATMY